MKRFYFLLLLLTVTFSTQAKDPISYRFGVDAGRFGYEGYSIVISPLLLQISPSFQLGLLGLGFQDYAYYDNSYDVPNIEFEKFESTLQMVTVKYDFMKFSTTDNVLPFIKVSTFMQWYNENYDKNLKSTVIGDVKIGLSFYSKHRGSNLSVYVGGMYGAYRHTVYSSKYSYPRSIKMPVLFNFGAQFELGGKGVWGYKKTPKTTEERNARKARRKNGWNNVFQIMSVVGEGLNAVGEAYGAVSNNNSGSTSQYSGGSTSTSGKSQSYYQTLYDRWEKRAISIYDSVTTADKGIWTNTQKDLFREAQSEMQKARQEAARDGYSIHQSRWEVLSL